MCDRGHISRTMPGSPDSVLPANIWSLRAGDDASYLAYMHPDVIDQMPANQIPPVNRAVEQLPCAMGTPLWHRISRSHLVCSAHTGYPLKTAGQRGSSSWPASLLRRCHPLMDIVNQLDVIPDLSRIPQTALPCPAHSGPHPGKLWQSTLGAVSGITP